MAADFSIVAVAIGLIFTFMILSLLVSSISTLISQIANTRARNLKNDLKDLFGDDDFARRFFAHPLINLSINKPTFAPDKVLEPTAPDKSASQSRPAEQAATRQHASFHASTVQSRTTIAQRASYAHFKRTRTGLMLLFAALGVVMAVLSQGAAASDAFVRVAQAVTGASDYVLIRDTVDVFLTGKLTGFLLDVAAYVLTGAIIGHVAASLIAHRFMDEVEELVFTTRVDHIEPEIFASVIERLTSARPTSERVEHILQDLYIGLPEANDNGTSPDKRARLTEWFNQWAQNSSAEFRRRQSVFAFVVAIILAIGVNADTLQIAGALFGDNDVRGQVNRFVDDWQKAQQLTDAGATGDNAPTVDGSADAITELLNAIDTLVSSGLPIGWELTPVIVTGEPGGCYSAIGQVLPECDNSRNLWLFWGDNTPHYAGLIFRKVVGILLTAIAIAQGAPFWFDLLNRLLGRKSSKDADETP